MLLDLYILVMLLGFFTFFIAFFFKGVPNTEILWAISLVCFGVIMFASTNVEVMTPQFDNDTGVYEILPQSNQYYTFVGVGFLFFSLSVLGLYVDIFEKYIQTSRGGK